MRYIHNDRCMTYLSVLHVLVLHFASIVLWQSVVGHVRMEGPWMQGPLCVTVQVVLVVLIVNVSALKRSCLDYMSFA